MAEPSMSHRTLTTRAVRQKSTPTMLKRLGMPCRAALSVVCATMGVCMTAVDDTLSAAAHRALATSRVLGS